MLVSGRVSYCSVGVRKIARLTLEATWKMEEQETTIKHVSAMWCLVNTISHSSLLLFAFFPKQMRVFERCQQSWTPLVKWRPMEEKKLVKCIHLLHIQCCWKLIWLHFWKPKRLPFQRQTRNVRFKEATCWVQLCRDPNSKPSFCNSATPLKLTANIPENRLPKGKDSNHQFSRVFSREGMPSRQLGVLKSQAPKPHN